MPLSLAATDRLTAALGDPQVGAEVIAAISSTSITQQPAPTAMTVTPTTGSLPVASTSLTIANAAAPTVSELLAYCTDLNAQVNALALILHNSGVTT